MAAFPVAYCTEYRRGGLDRWCRLYDARWRDPAETARFVMGQLSIGGGSWIRAMHVRMSDGVRVVIRLRQSQT
jgi:hypothetical protein